MNVIRNIETLRKEKGLNQEALADALHVDTAVISNIEKGKRQLKVSELENIANVLGVDVLYLFTYPEVYVPKIKKEDPIEAFLQIKLSADKKEQVLKLIFGDNITDILNK